MSRPARYKYPLQLPISLMEAAARLARNDGVSLNQWITSAVAQKIGRSRRPTSSLSLHRVLPSSPPDAPIIPSCPTFR